MTRPLPWRDGDIVAIAWFAVFEYAHVWDRLEEIDPDLSLTEIRALLARVRDAGHPVGPETPARLPEGERVAKEVARLFALVERARRAVAVAFKGPAALRDRLWATCRFPRTYMGLPTAEVAAADEVELIHLGDLPPDTPEWRERGRVMAYPNLKDLTLFNMRLGRHEFGIDLARLGQLQCLDLRENALERAPTEVTRCPSLRFLDLSDNPLTELPDLDGLPNLAYLGLAQTRVPKATVAALRRQRPDLTIER